MACFRGHMEIADTEFTVYVVGLYKLTHEVDCVEAQLPQAACGFCTNPFFEAALIRALSRSNVSAVSPGSAPTHPVRLENHDLIATLSEVNGTGQPGITGANNADISVCNAFQGRVRRSCARRCGIPGVNVFSKSRHAGIIPWIAGPWEIPREREFDTLRG